MVSTPPGARRAVGRRERFAGREAMPALGWDSVTVPGAVSAWAALHEKFGRLPFEALFEPAIRYARDGFLVTPVIARMWREQAPELARFAKASRGPSCIDGKRAGGRASASAVAIRPRRSSNRRDQGRVFLSRRARGAHRGGGGAEGGAMTATIWPNTAPTGSSRWASISRAIASTNCRRTGRALPR